MKLFIIFFIFFQTLQAEINLLKQENEDSNTTLLVIGGIHGDEPGGYFAASILATYYDITSKNVWVIPNLNQESIIRNNRGIHGDMNRKFSKNYKKDADAQTIEDVKKIITDKRVSLILNLHDGHGFYRKENKGNIFNPNAWGQTCVIDQCILNENQKFGNLNKIALQVKNNLNKNLLQKHHSFDIKNTNTKFDDEAMQLSLTYFAVTHNKPAFAIESSKNLSSLSQKVFYQLLAIEEFMKIMGINFTRKFEFSQSAISKILQEYGILKINNNIFVEFSDIKKYLRYIPLKSNSNEFSFTHPLGKVKKSNGQYDVFIGNKKITALKPQYFKMSDSCPSEYSVVIDKKLKVLKKASHFYVNDDFKILKSKEMRVNVIGYYGKGVVDESEIDINISNLSKQFSVDKSNKVYRVEFYKKDEFCSMLMVHFK